MRRSDVASAWTNTIELIEFAGEWYGRVSITAGYQAGKIVNVRVSQEQTLQNPGTKLKPAKYTNEDVLAVLEAALEKANAGFMGNPLFGTVELSVSVFDCGIIDVGCKIKPTIRPIVVNSNA